MAEVVNEKEYEFESPAGLNIYQAPPAGRQ